ncbi:hypothetical protein I352_05657 [Cryptococcus deuterogattii MMRL2647]|nr:hypothetical protein I352_05657 [Cryptococcus deuterogattii MMRL2647]
MPVFFLLWVVEGCEEGIGVEEVVEAISMEKNCGHIIEGTSEDWDMGGFWKDNTSNPVCNGILHLH